MLLHHFHNLKEFAHEREFLSVCVTQICDVYFFFFREFLALFAVTKDKLAAVHLNMATTEDRLVVGNQAAEEDNQDTTEVDNQVVEVGSQDIIKEDIQAAVEGSQGTVIRDNQLVVDIPVIVVGILDTAGIRKVVA